MAAINWKTTEEIAAEQAANQPSLFTYKTDIWSRCTDDEAEQLDGALQSSSVRYRRMWDDCITVEHDSALFTYLHSEMTTPFGSDRTDQLLAPST